MYVRSNTLHLCMLQRKWVINKSCIRVTKDIENSCKMPGHSSNLHLNLNIFPLTLHLYFSKCDNMFAVTVSHMHTSLITIKDKKAQNIVIFTGCPRHSCYLVHKVIGTQRSLASAFWKLTDLEIFFFLKYFHILSCSLHPSHPWGNIFNCLDSVKMKSTSFFSGKIHLLHCREAEHSLKH